MMRISCSHLLLIQHSGNNIDPDVPCLILIVSLANVFGDHTDVDIVMVCNGTAKSAEIGSRDMRVSTGQHADCTGRGGGFPFIYLFECVGGVLVGDCSRLGQVGADWTR